MIHDVIASIIVGFTHWYLASYRDWERERVRLWKLGLPWEAMPDEPAENRRLGLTRTSMRCIMVQIQFARST